MILSICDDPKILEIMRIVNIAINIIRIVVPIILIFVLMIKLMGAVTKSDEDGLQKVMKTAPKNILAAALVFLVPFFVRMVVKITAPDSEYEKCISITSLEEIEEIYEQRMEELVSKVEETLNINDYNTAYNYLKYIRDKDKRQEYEERLKKVKTEIDKNNNNDNNPIDSPSDGLGKDIVPTEELIEACKWIMHADEIQIRLLTCNDERYRYDNPEQELPGGAYILSNGIAKAKQTISLSDYQMGVFFGEQKIKIAADSRYAFMLIYKTSFIHNAVRDAIRENKTYGTGKEILYYAGSCNQNYRTTLRRRYYDSGKYKAEIDDTVAKTKYYVIVNADGTLTNAHYHAFTGIEQAIEKAGNEGKDFVEIIEKVIGKGNSDSKYYTTARVYDCRNLTDNVSSTGNPTENANRNIIYLGDSRTEAYSELKSQLGLDDNKESVYAKSGATINNYFTHIQQAKDEINNHPNINYAITVNYGTNDLHDKVKYCDEYKSFVSDMSNKNQFYIISVTPIDDAKNPWIKNTNIVAYNNYMQNTCIPEIKSNSPGKEVYYCDIYNKLSIDQWMKYIVGTHGEHYSSKGYKFIYDEIKKCISAHQ